MAASPGAKLVRLRLSKGIQAKDLALRLGHKDGTTLSKWENDRATPDRESIAKLAAALGMAESEVDYWDRLRERGVPMNDPLEVSGFIRSIVADAQQVRDWNDPAAEREFRDKVRAVLQDMERKRFAPKKP